MFTYAAKLSNKKCLLPLQNEHSHNYIQLNYKRREMVAGGWVRVVRWVLWASVSRYQRKQISTGEQAPEWTDPPTGEEAPT